MDVRHDLDQSSVTRISVLFVEENEDIRHLSRTYLTEEIDTIDVRFVSTPRDGLRFLENNRVDCLVSEYLTSGMNGLELLEEVRISQPDLPFILFTGKGSEEIASRAISAGVTDYIQKGGLGKYRLLAKRVNSAVEKYQSEKQLQRIRQRYELVGKVATDAFYEENLVTGRVIRSQGYSRNFGYEPDEIPTTVSWWKERIHPDDRCRALNVHEAALEDGSDEFETTYRFRMADGSYGYIKDRGTILTENGEPVCVIGTLTDITDQKERELELECANKRLQLALASAEIGVWEWRWETKELRWDDRVKEIYGVSEGSFRGSYADFINRVHPDDVEAVESAIEEAVEQNGGYQATFRILPDDGDHRWVEARGQAIVDADDEPKRMIGTIQLSEDQRRVLTVSNSIEEEDVFAEGH